MKYRKQCKGSITVFLCLVMTVMIAAVMMSLESAHQSAAKAQAAIAADEAKENVLSHYEEDLYEKYGLLAMNDRMDLKSLWKKSLKEYADKNMKGCHLKFQVVSIKQKETVYLGDDNAKAFQQEVNEIMAADTANKGIDLLKKQLESLTKGNTMYSTLSAVTAKGNDILVLEEEYEEINEILGKVRNRSAALKKYTERYRTYLKSNQKTDDKAVLSYREDIEKAEKKVFEKLKALRKVCKSYLEDADNLKATIQELKTSMEDDQLSEEDKELVKQQYETLETLTEGSSLRDVENVRKTVEDTLDALSSEYCPTRKQAAMLAGDAEQVEAFFKNALTALEKAEKLELEAMDQTIVEEEAEDDYGAASLISMVSNIMKEGPFGYIVGDTSKVSKRTVAKDNLPSVQYHVKSEKSSDSIFKRAVSSTANCCAMNMYIAEYLDCYTDGGNCDLEYVLGSKNKDLSNLKVVVGQLVLARSALNTVYLLKDRSKYNLAQKAATAIAAATGTPGFIQVITYAIIGAWAYAEAVCDVRTLVEGGKIPLMKTSSTWNLKLRGSEDILEENRKTKSVKKGLCYKDYLKLLLFLHKRTRNMYRTLDMIQWNECKRDAGFRISQCIYQTTFKTKVRIDPVFYSGLSAILKNKAVFQYSHEEVLKYQAVS